MSEYLIAILLTFVGFCLLAALLLIPVYRFLRREEHASQAWTPDRISDRARPSPPGGNGASPPDPGAPDG